MGLETKLFIGALALVVGCGNSSVSGHDDSDAGMNCRRGCDTNKNDGMGGNSQRRDSGSEDCCFNLFDGSSDGRDSGMENRAPSLDLVYESTHPLAGQHYSERNVRRMRDTTYLAETSDPDGDPVECRFEFSDGYSRDWAVCNVIHAFGSAGDYSLTARARDSRGLEGMPKTATLHVVNNIPPVARLPPCGETDPSDGLCVYRMAVWETYCWDGSASYDEDGSIVLYRLQPQVGGSSTSGDTPNRCAGYTEPGAFEGRYSVEDNEGAQGSINFHSIVE